MTNRNLKTVTSLLTGLLLLSACSVNSKASNFTTLNGPEDPPNSYKVTGVHDPSIVKGENFNFMVGSHLDAATTTDYVEFTKFASGVRKGNAMIPNVLEDMKEALDWAKTSTFWAGDIIQMKDGKYYFYYSVCEGSSPLAAIGYAVSANVEGPYENKGIIIKSGRSGKLLAYEPDKNIQYNADIHPNAIDPTLFYDENEVLHMVYGSYSGGIFILEMDEKTKMPVVGQGYGRRITGGKHTRIENPYIIYDKETDYYYFYASFGGLGSGHGYQTRVARSKDIMGPYLDSEGQDLLDIEKGVKRAFDDDAINPYGNKLMGDFVFKSKDSKMDFGYMSPGGASVIYDEDLKKTMFVFHTRFPGRGEGHELRSHEVVMNEDGWPLIAPLRYSGVEHTKANTNVDGKYEVVVHNLQIQGDIQRSKPLNINADNKELNLKTNGSNVELTYEGVVYKGVTLLQWDVKQKKMVKTITLQGDDNTTLWAIEG